MCVPKAGRLRAALWMPGWGLWPDRTGAESREPAINLGSREGGPGRQKEVLICNSSNYITFPSSSLNSLESVQFVQKGEF